tara:strand:- start:886 stop:1068 length:183 start_codon:yes stop_codon:yes gene_type:complete
MVKKIRVIDEAPSADEKPTDNDLMELAKSMDWKLWEMLQILQRFEKKFDESEESITVKKK